MNHIDHFPVGFDFFGMGEVKEVGIPRKLENSKLLLLFEIQGDENAHCLISFENSIEDESMAMEVANILASKLVNSICDEGGLQIELNPPRVLDPQEKIRHLLEQSAVSALKDPYRARSYQFLIEGRKYTIQMIYISSQRGTA